MRYSMVVIKLAVWTSVVSPGLTSTAVISGHFGCSFSASLCHVDEECFDDNLFGNCQSRSRAGGGWIDNYQYHLNGTQLSELYHIVLKLVADGYTWHHRQTQCVLYATLSRYRHGSVADSIPMICGDIIDIHSLDGQFQSGIVNSSQSDMQQMSPNVRNGLSRNYDKDLGKFKKLMQSIRAEDLLTLKHFLLDDAAYKRPVSFKTVPPEPVKPSVVPSAHDLPASDKAAVIEVTSSSGATDPASSVEIQPVNEKKTETQYNLQANSDDVALGVESDISSDSADTSHIVLYVLIGLAIILAVVFIVVFCQYCRTYRMSKEEELDGLVSSRVTAEEYEDLCRQHMGSKLSAKQDTLLSGRVEKPIFDLRHLLSRSSSVQSVAPSLQDELVGPQIDMNTGTLVLSYMERYVHDTERIHREWDELSIASANVQFSEMASDAFESTNAQKNRYADILPFEKSRVVLNAENNASGSSYINASTIVDGDPRNPVYIATQGPLQHTVDDFWQMIWDQGCTVIVNLTCLMEDSIPLCHQYWPDADREFYHIYEVVLLSSHVNSNDFVVRNFMMRNVDTGELRNVTQFHFVSWPSTAPSVPESIQSLLDFRRRVNKSFRGRAPVVVHCSDGSGRTGTYCLIDLVLNRIVNGVKQVDMAATLEHLRDQRHLMVHTKEQYEFALEAVAQEVHSLLFPSVTQ